MGRIVEVKSISSADEGSFALERARPSALRVAERAILFVALRFVGMAWSTFECFRYSAMLKRRAEIGLAQPMVAHRFSLWGIGAGAQVAVLTFELGSWFVTGNSLTSAALGLHFTSALGLAGTVAIALAFFPPAAYERFIEGFMSTDTASNTTGEAA